MARGFVDSATMIAIADAIREKSGGVNHYKPSEMATAIRAIETGAAAPDYVFDQRNDAVKAYLENVVYDPNDYSTSQITTYTAQSTSYRKDQPVGAEVTTGQGMLTVVDGGNLGADRYSVTGEKTTLYNLTPGAQSQFGIVRDGKLATAGTVRPTGSLRMLRISGGGGGVKNARDLGGWPCDGGTVRYGRLFRTSELNGEALPQFQIDEAGIAAMRNLLRIDYEVDLRGDSETDGEDNIPGTADDITTSPLGDGVAYIRFPVMYYKSGVQLGTALATTMRDCLLYIMGKAIAGKPGFFHCVYGRDRTATVACILLALLGVSQSDIDKDYELTNFADLGVIRDRTAAAWSGSNGLITYFNTFQGDSFRDRVAQWAVQLGVPLETINAFRRAMVDGTPEDLVAPVAIYNVSNILSGAVSDNPATTATQYQPYEANIRPVGDRVIQNVTVTMGGEDVTASVFTGKETRLMHSIANNLVGCTTDNNSRTVADGLAYTAQITANDGYTLTGAAVTITMGGVDVSTYYSEGKITIPSVTGDLVIRVEAVATVPAYINQIPLSQYPLGTVCGLMKSKRWNSEGQLVDAASTYQANATGFIPVKPNDVIRFSPGTFTDSGSNTSSYAVRVFDSNGSYLSFYPATKTLKTGFDNPVWDGSSLMQITVTHANAAYIAVSNYSLDENGVITVNEEIV